MVETVRPVRLGPAGDSRSADETRALLFRDDMYLRTCFLSGKYPRVVGVDVFDRQRVMLFVQVLHVGF